MTPQEDEDNQLVNDLFPIKEEQEDDKQSAKGTVLEEKEFKLKRNVDKTKAKNPKKKGKN